MNKDIVILDLFSGIGGFSRGLTSAGFNITKHYFSEIDKHAIAIYKYHFKNSEYVGSVTTLDGRTITRPNIITFGSPCQDFSVAGKRAGMEGQRSSLIGEALRLIAECRPNVFIWENVKGVFSSNSGADFWAIIQAFTNIGGYRLEWQLLNTSWFLPQNRERIYLVGHLTTDRGDWQGVFPIREDTGWIDEGATRATVNTLTAGGNSGGMRSSMTLIEINEDKWVSLNEPQYGKYVESDFVQNLTATGKASHTAIRNKLNIRRLTEIECEALQGFPSNWTEYGDYDGVVKKVAKTQRYKCLGNAVTCRVVEEIGKRLLNI